jgi:hypothetical protein
MLLAFVRARWIHVLIFSLLAATLANGPAIAGTDLALTDMYSMQAVTRVMLDIPATSYEALSKPETWWQYAPASVQFVQGDKLSAVMNVGVRVKGSTSQTSIANKASIKIKFNWSDTNTGVRYLGLRLVTLNAMSQDGSFLHEYGAYSLYKKMGEVTPRTGWAEVFVNGISKGVYLNVESIDEQFVRTHFTDVTQHLYEATARRDLKWGSDDGAEDSGAYLVRDGWKTTPNKADLSKLIEVAQLPAGPAWWRRLGVYMDTNRLVAAFAVENFIGSWDSYSGPVVNNYYLRSNSKGKFTLIPWGPDNTFGEWRTPGSDPTTSYFMPMDTPASDFPWIAWADKTKATWPRGVLFQKCLKYVICKNKYLAALKKTSAVATNMQLIGLMQTAATVIDGLSTDTVREQQARTYRFIDQQQVRVRALLKKYKVK